MKKFLTFLVVLGAVAAGGHYMFWNYVANKAETNFNAMVKDRMKHQMGTLDYTLEKSGYPSNITFTMKDISFEIPQMDIKAVANSASGVKISVPFSLDADTFTIESADANYTLSFIEAGEKVDITIGIGNVKSTVGNKGNTYTHNGVLQDLTLALTAEQEAANINVAFGKIAYTEKTTKHAAGTNGTLDSNISVNMTDGVITLNSPEGKTSFNVDEYTIKGGVENFPNMPLTDLQTIVAKLSESNQANQPADTKDLKAFLDQLVKEMAKHDSILHMDEITYKLSNLPDIGKFSTTLNLSLSVADDYTPRGDMGIKLDGLGKIAENMLKNPSAEQMQNLPPMALAFMQAGKLELYAKMVDGGMLMFNGMPVFQVPPLDTLIAQIPDIIAPPQSAMVEPPVEGMAPLAQ